MRNYWFQDELCLHLDFMCILKQFEGILNIGQSEIPSDMEIQTVGHWSKRYQSC